MHASSLASWLAVIAVQRVGAILLLRPGGWFYDYSDYHTYWQYARVLAEGFWPYRDFWLEYPPLFPLLNQALYALSLRFPPLADPRFWHHLLLALALLPFDLGVAALLHRLAARLWGAARAEWTLAVWALLFAPLFLWQGHFDVLPLFGLLLTVWAVAERRPVVAGVGLAFGFLAKLLSLLALPAALRAGGDQGSAGIKDTEVGFLLSPWNGRMLVVFGLLVGAVLGPLWLVGPEWMAATARNFGGRGAWQTVWALADGQFGSGIVVGDRFDPTPDFAREASRVPWPLVHALFGALGFWLWTRRWRWERVGVQVAFVAATVGLFYLWSKGWSPQFTLMLLPWLLLLWPDARGLAAALLFTALMVGENLYFNFVVYRWDDARGLLVVLVLLRTGALLAMTVGAVARLRAWSEPALPTGERGDGRA